MTSELKRTVFLGSFSTVCDLFVGDSGGFWDFCGFCELFRVFFSCIEEANGGGEADTDEAEEEGGEDREDREEYEDEEGEE